ncbi:four helix bundle protein [Opitutaceae bacterium EW11]|nr:four helix bundle protein [Opitutaceae bacterium EW11]
MEDGIQFEGGFWLEQGQFRELGWYQTSEIVQALTSRFCIRHGQAVDGASGPMLHAARSGRQYLIQGGLACSASRDAAVRLTCVARASLQELLAAYERFLRMRGHPVWAKDSSEARYVRRLGVAPAGRDKLLRLAEGKPAETAANVAICLLQDAVHQLDLEIRRLEQEFLREGGLSERMARARKQATGE